MRLDRPLTIDELRLAIAQADREYDRQYLGAHAIDRPSYRAGFVDGVHVNISALRQAEAERKRQEKKEGA